MLTAALARFPDDLYLRQLTVLLPSLAGDLPGAIAALEALPSKFQHDEESIGIAAGVYKRMWRVRSSRNGSTGLMRCTSTAGARSKQTNSYLGINAATTALWLGKPAMAQAGRGVQKLFHGPIRGLVCRASRIFWDDVTLAEAELLLGELAESADQVPQGIPIASEEIDPINVAREQASGSPRRWGLTFQSIATRGDPASAVAREVLVVGVTGHRTLPDDDHSASAFGKCSTISAPMDLCN